MTKAFTYLRVSGPAQVDGDGFPRQRETIARYARSHNIEIVEEFRDEGVPGKTEMHNRPGLAALMVAIEANGVRLVLVEIADRLARDSIVAELIIKEFQKLGVRVICASGEVDLTAGTDTNPTAKLIRQILAAVSEFDKDMIVLKTRAARDRLRLKNGKCEGQLKFGDRPGEQGTLQIILENARLGQSPLAITNMLNLLKIPNRRGKAWNSGTIWKIVQRNL